MSAEQQANARKVIAVVGGGVSGLAAAYELTRRASPEKPAPEVVLLEASSRTGGTVRTERRDGFLLEAGPDSFISDKPAGLELAKEIGLEPNLITTNDEHRRAFVVRGGRLRPVPEGFQLLAPSRLWPFVTTDIFSWPAKLRIALEMFVPRRRGDETDDESLAAFVRRRFGREALERMAQPMVGGIYTADPELLSLRATMPRFTDMEREHGSVIRALLKARRRAEANERNGERGTSGARYGLFVSLDAGLQLLTERLAEQLPPGTVRTNARAESLKFDEASRRWCLRLGGGETLAADAVCLALPAYASADLLRATDSVLAAELEAIRYASTATVNLAFSRSDIPHPLDGFGFVVPHVERRRVIACSFSSVKFAGRAPAGRALLRAFVGGALQPEMFQLDDGAMTAAALEDLRELLGVVAPPLFAQVSRWPRSMAQYTVGHIARMRRVRARLEQFPSLRLAGNAYTGAGLPDCIREGRTAAQQLLKAVSY
ncbi:MAG TPA: protoporphyrinogen oxidase [Pyrinomonadaceae bacterium]|nr:protoporphyrinogen oxidase [Pyrinomonadaceae bacterium]